MGSLPGIPYRHGVETGIRTGHRIHNGARPDSVTRLKKAEKAKVRFAVIDDDSIEIKDDELYDNYLLINKGKWEELKKTKNIVWN